MSAIWGIFRKNGEPISDKEIQDIQNSLIQFGPEGSDYWRNGSYALGYFKSFLTPEARYEKQPLFSKCGNYVVVADARIDDRENLMNRLQIPTTLRNTTPDSELIIQAYEKWGENCCANLIGNWAFAILDLQQKKWILSRDIMGSYSIYYYDSPKVFVFSSSIKTLLKIKETPFAPNFARVAHIVAPINLRDGNTAYQDIHYGIPAHNTIVTEKEIRIKRYWFPEEIAPITMKSDDDYVEAFLALYRQVIKDYLRSDGKVASQLSGGLDSGSVAALAAEIYKQRGEKLVTFSSVPWLDLGDSKLSDRILDETPNIRKTATYSQNIDFNLVKSEDISPVGALKRILEITGQPARFIRNAYWLLDIIENARDKNITTLLNGQEGNGTVSRAADDTLLIHLLNGKIKQSFREIFQTRKMLHLSFNDIYRQYFLKQLKLNKSRIRNKNILNILYAPNKNILNPEMLERLDLLEKLKFTRDKRINPKTKIISESKLFLYRIRHPHGLLLRNDMSRLWKIDQRDPTSDVRIIEFIWGLPLTQFYQNGMDRRLIRRALKNILPDEVLMNRRRGLQAADIALRVYRIKDELDSEFTLMENSATSKEFLNVPKLKNLYKGYIDSMLRNEYMSFKFEPILKGISASIFLRKFD